MPETIAIEKATVNSIQRLLSRIEAKLDREEFAATVDEKTAAVYCGWSIGTFRNKISDGTVPASAIVETHGKKRFRLEKLIKK